MNLLELWWTGVTHPQRAFNALGSKPAPQWGFRVVLIFNLAISVFTLLPLFLLGSDPLLPSALTFLPTEQYLLAEIFFLPPLRIVVWMLGAAVIHLALRLVGQPGGFDQLLNIGGLEYLVVMPFILASDWLLIAVDRYDMAMVTHSLALPWSMILTVVGLNQLLGVKRATAWGLVLLNTLTTLPFLAVFAR